MELKPHQNFEAWKKSFEFVLSVYKISGAFPAEEKFGITSQIRRASVSIPVNIAEGAARKSDTEFLQFLYIALGSLSETDTLLLLCKELKFITEGGFNLLYDNLNTIGRLLNGLIRSVKVKLETKKSLSGK